MQYRYWISMVQKKYSLVYLEEHFSNCIKYDRYLSIFVALVSSSSIAAWTIWNSLGKFWAFLVAITHVITAINGFFPYKKRIAEISELKLKLGPIYDSMQYNWYKVQSGEMTESEINDLLHSFITQWTEIDGKYFVSDHLSANKNFIKNAETKTNDYFEKLFKED